MGSGGKTIYRSYLNLADNEIKSAYKNSKHFKVCHNSKHRK